MSQLFTTGSGQTVIAGAELGRGGEGTVLEVRGDPSRCIKLYSGQIAEAARGKLSVMIARPPLDPTLGASRHHSIAWPEQLLFRTPGRTGFAGFLMPRVDGKVFRTALSYLSPESRVKDLGGAFNWKYLYTAATNVASSVGALHEKGYCIGDLNESNLLIAPNALITIIDCDSFQVPDPATGKIYRCLVGKPEYTAPELQGRYGEIDRTLATDRFALGVLLFQLLMEGTHPYQSRGEAVEDLPSTQQKILKGLFPYSQTARGAVPPAFAPPFDLLDPNLRQLFLRCFDAGHGDPAARPSAQEWFNTLRNRESLLLTCKSNDNHVYFSHLKECPWCERAQIMGRDSFPNPLGTQIALADPRAPLPSVEARLRDLRRLAAFALADGAVTSQEREYLINRGRELQLTKAQVETLLEAEMSKAGAMRSVLSKVKPLPFKPAGAGGAGHLARRKQRSRLVAAGAILCALAILAKVPGLPALVLPWTFPILQAALLLSLWLRRRRARGLPVPYAILGAGALLVAILVAANFPAPKKAPAPVSTTVVANPKPSLPFKDDQGCLAATCDYGNWVALRSAVARKEPQTGAAVAFTAQRGDLVSAENGYVLTLASGDARVIQETSLGTGRLKAGETVYPLHAVGKDQTRVWYQEKAYDVDTNALKFIEQPKAVWWVRMYLNGEYGWTDETAAFRPKH